MNTIGSAVKALPTFPEDAMSAQIRELIADLLQGPDLETYLADVRRGAEPCPSDKDILQALQIKGAKTPSSEIQVVAIEFAKSRLERRRIVAQRQRRRAQEKLRYVVKSRPFG